MKLEEIYIWRVPGEKSELARRRIAEVLDYFYAPRSIGLADSIAKKLLIAPRMLFFAIQKDLAVRILGDIVCWYWQNGTIIGNMLLSSSAYLFSKRLTRRSSS